MQEVARELNPDPVKLKTVFIDPDVGVTIMLAVELNGVPTTSCVGVPITCTFQFTFVVAYGPTMKLPIATVWGPIEQVGEVIKFVFGAPVAELIACILHPVSDAESPFAMKVTVAPLDAMVGLIVNFGGAWVTFSIACAKSPTLGAQPLLPTQPVTSITYCPGGTFPTRKLPFTTPVPTAMTQPADPGRIGLKSVTPGELGLEIEHD